MLKVGDFIRGKKDNGYRVTNERMTKGQVIDTFENGRMRVKVLEHKSPSCVGDEFIVSAREEKFDIIETKKDDQAKGYVITELDVEFDYGRPRTIRLGEGVVEIGMASNVLNGVYVEYEDGSAHVYFNPIRVKYERV